MLSTLIVISVTGYAPLYKKLSFVRQEPKGYAFYQADEVKGTLRMRRRWGVVAPGMKVHHSATGSHYAVLWISDRSERSFLEVREINGKGRLIASFESRNGFTAAWNTPDCLVIGGDLHGMNLPLSKASVKVVPSFRAKGSRELFPSHYDDARRIQEEIHKMGKAFYFDPLGTFPGDLFPLNSNGQAVFDKGAGVAVAALRNADSSCSIMLFRLPSYKAVAELQRRQPRMLSVGGGLAAVLEGPWDVEGPLYFYSLANGRYLGKTVALCVG